ncbi:MAG: MliC family protein [Desulfobacteraceae bacterium]|jgi:uncharacterized protein|nr:MliC family protein [Desulfobacteraceae bacterium]
MGKRDYFFLIVLILGLSIGRANAADPSFDCGKSQKGSIEELICKDEGLSLLDRKMATVYAEATQRAKNEHPPVLKAEQRGWIKGRNDCWKSEDQRQCIEESYKRRIAELQARYRLVAEDGPCWYACDGDPRNEVVVSFFKTDPPTLIAERGDSVSLMYLEPSGSGSKYRGRNESLWEHQGEATIVWGCGSPEMRCTKKPSAEMLASVVGADDRLVPLADLPIVDMEIVDPVKYRAASDLAAGGSTPLDIVLKVAGQFEGSTQHIIQVNQGSEAPSASRLTVLRDGLMDDSVRGVRWDIALEKTTAGVWWIKEVKHAWRCWRGEQLNRFATVPCP